MYYVTNFKKKKKKKKKIIKKKGLLEATIAPYTG